MKVMDLFSGWEGWSKPFKDRGHDVITVDINSKFNPTICKDIFDLNEDDLPAFWEPDIVLSSPPCNCFSQASVYVHWDKTTKKPKDVATMDAIDLVAQTLQFTISQHPRWWILENPRGMMRRILGNPQITTYMALWQSPEEINLAHRAFHNNVKPHFKATDFWGVIPKVDWNNPTPYSIHRTFPAEATDRELRAVIPYGLALAVCKACEKAIFG